MIHRAGTPRTRPYTAVPLPPEPLELDACYRYCEALARARHHNFPVASMFVPSALRRPIFAVYAFARTADDFADEPEFEGRRAAELDRWDERLHRCYHGEAPDHPVFVALADAIARFDLPITELSAMIQGFRADLEVRRYATFTALRGYTALAAEPVGHLLLYLGGYREPALHHFADDLATGLALAKLLQDIAADAARGRIYRPAEDLHHFGIDEADLLAFDTAGPSARLRSGGRAPAGLADLVRFEVARTRSLFERARPLVDRIGPELGVELALIWHGGMRILHKIERAGAGLMAARPRINELDKALVVTRALAWRGDSLVERLRR
ncbi:MAG TPA: squalene/phytoene synthase family protein [Kofleriaceae bacterium]|nr:squalene/phytoene synthase family protein [Kofleriaceae bacterium]